MYRVNALLGGEFPARTAAEADWAAREVWEPCRRAIILACHTGRRRSDLIAILWSKYDGAAIEVEEEKTDAGLRTAVPRLLEAELEAWRGSATSTLIRTAASGRPWDGAGPSRALGRQLASCPASRRTETSTGYAIWPLRPCPTPAVRDRRHHRRQVSGQAAALHGERRPDAPCGDCYRAPSTNAYKCEKGQRMSGPRARGDFDSTRR